MELTYKCPIESIEWENFEVLVNNKNVDIYCSSGEGICLTHKEFQSIIEAYQKYLKTIAVVGELNNG